MEIHLIRHTTPAVEKGIVYGQRLDVGLAKTFHREADKISTLISKHSYDAVICSPALRCIQLADYIFKGNYKIDPRIAEMDFGAWEGRKWNDIPQDELDAWMKSYKVLSPPGGENLNQME